MNTTFSLPRIHLRRLYPTLALALCAFPLAAPALADSPRDREANFASHSGNLIYLALGAFLPLATDGSGGKRQTLRNLDAVATSTLLCEGLKLLVREKRPDSEERTSFPSGHATAAFAMARMQADRHPDQAILWYGGAALIAESRVHLHRHYTQDVIAGALLGVGTAAAERNQPRGFLIAPFIRPNSSGKGRTVGLSLSRSF